MSNENDVIVFDEEYIYAAKEIENYCSALVKMIDRYSASVNTILNQAIQDEVISSRLSELLAKVESVKTTIETTGEEAAATCRTYISEIDKADNFLY